MTPSSPLPSADARADDTGEHGPARPPVNTAAGKVAPPQPAKIPVSAYAPVPLARPLSVFGAKFEVHISASCTLSMNTAMQAVTDTSLQTFLRTEEPALLQNLKTLHFAGTGKHRPSATTRKLIRQNLKLLDSEAVSAVLDGREPPPFTYQSDWRLMLQGMNNGGVNFVRDIATDLAAWDDQALQIRELSRVGEKAQAHAHTEAMLGTSPLAWEALNPGLLQAPQVLILVESSLQTLARLVCRIDRPSVDLPSRESWVTQLLDAGVVGRSAPCPFISHILAPACASRSAPRRLEDRYYAARFLTFCATWPARTFPATRRYGATSKSNSKSRFIQLYRLEVAQPLARGSTV